MSGSLPPDFNLLVGRAGVDDAVRPDGDGVDGIVVGRYRLEALEVGDPPDLEGLVPGDGVEEAAGDGNGRDGVGVLDPEALAVATNADVVRREWEAAEAVGESGEGGVEADLPGICRPGADFSVLMGGEEGDSVRGDGDGLDGAGGGEGGDAEELTVVR